MNQVSGRRQLALQSITKKIYLQLTQNMSPKSGKPPPIMAAEHLPTKIIRSFPINLLLPISPPEPSASAHHPNSPSIVIIGAGITGLTVAAHCIGHGFTNLTIFESGSSPGGIWNNAPTNTATSRQINTAIYRPSVPLPSSPYSPNEPEPQPILSQIRSLSERYNLPSKTRFNTRVEDIYRDHDGKWIINSPRLGSFDGVICCVGSVGEARVPRMPGLDRFLRAGAGQVWHSSKLAEETKKCDVKGKKVAIIDDNAGEEGGGVVVGSGVIEALEFAAAGGAERVSVLLAGRERRGPGREKWMVSRGIIGDVALLLGTGLVGRLVPELLLRRMFYRGLDDLEMTLDAETVQRLRSVKAEWIRCDIDQFIAKGVKINGCRGGGKGSSETIETDVVVMATGYKRPQLSEILPGMCFAPPYRPPNWFLETFPTNHSSIACINCGKDSGNWHIGLQTRILLMFLVDHQTKPSPFWMQRWIDITRTMKATSPIGSPKIFSYLELGWWFFLYVIFNPLRWKWVFFLLFGSDFMLPGDVGRRESGLRQGTKIVRNASLGIYRTQKQI